ncbi:ABC transporter ATP-binding protein [Ligilactobacillus salitolerans]|uniref:ABC transporter ATP-binding protein n=2 Tax=Ligilactobacillus salitolerans TaxID=1808352 RepID=A0A401IQL4_9LACO|nr:ABC transporter ATP-binding protein [Ligilactobacillus salitolerans]
MEEIVVTNLGKTFGAREILKSVSFSVAQGEFVALVGPSGAGKSTLLNLLGLLDEPSTGEIRLHGDLLPKINSKKATLIRREQINYLFQSFALISNETVFQNLWLAMNFVHQSSSDKKSAIHEVLARLGISDLQNELVNTLSGGEQQRVAIARAILKPGELILADEPTGALDPANAQAALQEISKLRDDYHKTIIMVTHNLEEAHQTDRIISLTDLQK